MDIYIFYASVVFAVVLALRFWHKKLNIIAQNAIYILKYKRK